MLPLLFLILIAGNSLLLQGMQHAQELVRPGFEQNENVLNQSEIIQAEQAPRLIRIEHYFPTAHNQTPAVYDCSTFYIPLIMPFDCLAIINTLVKQAESLAIKFGNASHPRCLFQALVQGPTERECIIRASENGDPLDHLEMEPTNNSIVILGFSEILTLYWVTRENRDRINIINKDQCRSICTLFVTNPSSRQELLKPEINTPLETLIPPFKANLMANYSQRLGLQLSGLNASQGGTALTLPLSKRFIKDLQIAAYFINKYKLPISAGVTMGVVAYYLYKTGKFIRYAKPFAKTVVIPSAKAAAATLLWFATVASKWAR